MNYLCSILPSHLAMPSLSYLSPHPHLSSCGTWLSQRARLQAIRPLGRRVWRRTGGVLHGADCGDIRVAWYCECTGTVPRGGPSFILPHSALQHITCIHVLLGTWHHAPSRPLRARFNLAFTGRGADSGTYTHTTLGTTLPTPNSTHCCRHSADTQSAINQGRVAVFRVFTTSGSMLVEITRLGACCR